MGGPGSGVRAGRGDMEPPPDGGARVRPRTGGHGAAPDGGGCMKAPRLFMHPNPPGVGAQMLANTRPKGGA